MTEITEGADSGSLSRNGVTVPLSNGKASYAEQNKVADHFIGGNKLENASDSKVKDFVAGNDGHTVITNVSSLSCKPCLQLAVPCSGVLGSGRKETDRIADLTSHDRC